MRNQIQGYCPEMGEAKPKAQIEILGSGRVVRIRTPLELPKMRGLTFLQTYKSSDLCDLPRAQRLIGWHSYDATKAAIEKLQVTYTMSREMVLD